MVTGACLGFRRLRRRPPLDSSLSAHAEDLFVAGFYFAGILPLAGQTPGQAVLGLRVVDDQTYQRAGWRALLTRWLVLQLPHILVVAVSASPSARTAMTALEAVRPEADELRRRYGRDRRQLNEALLDLYNIRAVDPWAAGWRLLAAATIGMAYGTIVAVGVLRSPRRQGLHDRLANVVVIDDRGEV